MTYIALQPDTLAGLLAITAPKGVRALLPNGAQYVQSDGPTGDNWTFIGPSPAGPFLGGELVYEGVLSDFFEAMEGTTSSP